LDPPHAILEPFGDAALRVRLPDGVDGRSVLVALRALPGVIDAVVTERHALVTFDPEQPPRDVGRAVAHATKVGAPAVAAGLHEVRVRYDGEDIEEVARAAGLSASEVIALHVSGEYRVAAIGFLPGFAYLRGLDARLIVPRRPVPRPRIAARSVAVAGPYSGVYPFASPGGWNILGTAVDFSPFDPDSGARLALGDRVRFTRDGREQPGESR
jgi:5-oxoprolinase (ATP-hydrolysing) subunit A